MCFAVPYKVIKTTNGKALLEGGKTVVLSPDITVRAGEYVRIAGNIVIDSLSTEDGDAIRQTIRELSSV